MGSCSSNQKILKQIKAQDEQLTNLITLNQKLAECLNGNSSKLENSTESPEFRQYKNEIDDRFSSLEKQVAEIYFKLRKLNIFENEIPEFTEIDDAQINSLESALNHQDLKENNNINNKFSEIAKIDKNMKSEKMINDIKKPPRQQQQQHVKKNQAKRLRQKNISSPNNQISQSTTQQNKIKQLNGSKEKFILNSDDFIMLAKASKLSDQIKEETSWNQKHNSEKKENQKKKQKENSK